MESPEKLSQLFARLRRFNQQIPRGDFSHAGNTPNITFEDHIIGQKDILEPALSQFAHEPTLIQDFIRTTQEALPGKFNKMNLLVLMDSMQVETGFLVESVAEIARSYNQLLFADSSKGNIQPARLEHDRQYIRDHGPILGLLSHNVLELKLCFATHLSGDHFIYHGSSNHRVLTRINEWLTTQGKRAHKNFFPQLERLALKQLNRNARREVTPAMVKRLLGCDCATAETLSYVYQRLPVTPLGVR